MDSVTRQHNFLIGGNSFSLVRKLLASSSNIETITTQLIRVAEHQYQNRNIDALREIAELLATFPNQQAKQIGLWYLSICQKRHGDIESAVTNLGNLISNSSTPRLKARSLQSLGTIYHEKGDYQRARELYDESLKLNADNLLTICEGQLLRSALTSLEGDHRGSLKQLLEIEPAIKLIGQARPLLRLNYLNDISYELLRLGKVQEASRVIETIESNPLFNHYSELQETKLEIAQSLPSRVIVVIPEVRKENDLQEDELQAENSYVKPVIYRYLFAALKGYKTALLIDAFIRWLIRSIPLRAGPVYYPTFF